MSTETTELIAVHELPALDSISATQAALQQRDSLLMRARKGVAITTPEAAQKAAAFLKELVTFTRTIEETRKTVKAPVLDVGKRIDAVASELTRDLDAEYKRINGLLGTFAAEQKRKEEEARRKAWEEQERIRKEAEEKERLAREKAEADRRAKEEAERKEREERERKAREEQERIAAQAAKARSEKARAEAEQRAKEARERAEREEKEAAMRAELDRKNREEFERQEAEKRRQEAEAAAAKAAQAVIPAPVKLAGIATGSEIKFEVTDVVALYEAAPAFVILSPNNAALKAALKALPEGKTIPGVRHWREAKAVVR